MITEKVEKKILDNFESVFLKGKDFLGENADTWEEYALDAIVENIGSIDILFMLKHNDVSLSLKLEIENALIKRARWILANAYREQLIDWGFRELLEGE